MNAPDPRPGSNQPNHLAKWALKARKHHEREAAQLARNMNHHEPRRRAAQLAMIEAHGRAVAMFAGVAAGLVELNPTPTTPDELGAEAKTALVAREKLSPLLDYCRARLAPSCEAALIVGIPIGGTLQLLVCSTNRDRLAPPLHGWASKVLAEMAAAAATG